MYYFNTCFLCLEQHINIKSVFLQDIDGVLIKEKLKYILSEFENFNPNITKNICIDCLKDVNLVYKFKQKFLKNMTVLNDFYEKQTVKIESTPDYNEYQITPDCNTELRNETIKTEVQENEAINESKTGQENIDEEVEMKEEYSGLHHEVFIKEEPLYQDEDETQTDLKDNLEVDQQNETTNNTDTASSALLPNRSKNRYEKQYSVFCEWRKAKGAKGVNQELILEFLIEQSAKYKPTSLWAFYSMLKKTLITYENVNVGNFSKVSSFLKTKSVGYVSKKSAELSRAEIEKFLKDAPNEEFLLVKAITIFGVYGGLLRQELCDVKVKNVKEEGSVIIVRIPDAKINDTRTFTIFPDGNGFNPVQLLQQYMSLRPGHVKNDRFFLSYRNEKCTIQPVGIKAIGKFPSIIAGYLGLENASSYTGHCYRRTSATLLANSGADVLTLKRHGFWKPSVESNSAESVCKKINIDKIIQGGDQKRIKTDRGPWRYIKRSPQQDADDNFSPSASEENSTNSLECSYCHKTFASASKLKVHKRIHTNERPYKCDICDMAYKQIGQLTYHKRVHTGEKPFKCDICNKAFNKSSYLTIHKRMHTSEKPYKCDVCNKEYCQSSALAQHRRIHTNERPYECEICHEAFTQNANKLRHIKRRHPDSKQTRDAYVCDVCDKVFQARIHLNEHKKVHIVDKPFKCSLCDKAFGWKNVLEKHILTHIGEIPFKCNECNQRFARESTLQEHMQTHNK